jgi:hypothetical protein
MDIVTFGNILKTELENRLGDDYFITLQEVIKNNGIVHNGVTIKKNGCNVAPTIYYDELLPIYEKGESLDKIVGAVLSLYKDTDLGGNMDFGFFKDFDAACPTLSFKLVQAKPNEKRLKDVPVKLFEDLYMIPICIIRIKGEEQGSVTITREHLKMWEVSEQELWENIMDNTTVVYPATVRPIAEYLRMPDIGLPDILDDVYVVTNESYYHGAAAVLYPGVLRRIAEKVGDDLFVIPSSVHEMIVMPSLRCQIPPECLRAMICEVNDSVIREEDVLSPSLYYYSRQREELKIWDLDLKLA